MNGERLRARLRETTRSAHERMHGHAGFGAAAAGKLAARDYCDLLARLFGFHQPFEAGFEKAPPAMAQAIVLSSRRRSEALTDDLRALGLTRDLETLPRCQTLPTCVSEPQWLGALYITEGSTLGGALIAPALERAGFARSQRNFFEIYGERRAWMWRNFLARLETYADNPEAAREAEYSARSAFEAFEVWMRDWDGAAALR